MRGLGELRATTRRSVKAQDRTGRKAGADRSPLSDVRAGSRLRIGGREYVDFHHGWGAAVLGWADPVVDGAAADPAPANLEGELAARLGARLPFAEGAVFRTSFPRLLADALAAAKAVTGRDAAWFCDFAGRLDTKRVAELLDTAPGGVAALVVDTLDAAPTLLADLRWLADRHGAVLIFDDSRSAFRVHGAGGYGVSGVEPDLALIGAGLANGRPLSAAAGRLALLQSLPSGERASDAVLAAGCAALDRMERLDVAAALRVAGSEIAAEVDSALRRSGADRLFTVEGDPTFSRLVVRGDAPGRPGALSEFVEAALYEAGVIAPAAHVPAWTTREPEIARLVRAYEGALQAVTAAVDEGRFERRERRKRVAQ